MAAKNDELRLKFHGRIIDQLGSQTYQSPVASLAELIANAWDADATEVDVSLPENVGDGAEIVIRDNGSGLSFQECQDRYLNIGWCRRGKDPVGLTEGKRPVLGRKGIGKFAGFGIARVIHVRTISGSTGEMISFEMDLEELTGDTYMEEGGRLRAEYHEGKEGRKKDHGTTITLKKLFLKRAVSLSGFPRSLARRFMLQQTAAEFKICVNGKPIPETEDLPGIEFSFPRDYTSEETPEGMEMKDGFGIETLPNGKTISWRVQFYKDTISDEELQGITVFSNIKLAQSPFFFNLSGGLGGQAGQSYMSGKVLAHYVDQLPEDLMSAERQRINWDHAETAPLLDWGQKRVKQLLVLWHDRRGKNKREILERKIAGFSVRLARLKKHEQKTVRGVLEKLAGATTLTYPMYEEIGNALLTAWESGRLHELMATLSASNSTSPNKLLETLLEADIITALNMAEIIKTRVLEIRHLRKMVNDKELEAAVRDYLAQKPWILSPDWETFKVESSVNNIIKEIAGDVGFLKDMYKGRVDLVLKSGKQLLVLEFMRPGLNLNWDHINRFEQYIRKISNRVKSNTILRFREVTGLIVADRIDRAPDIVDKIESLERESMLASDWGTLLDNALSKYDEFMDAVSERGNGDERLRRLSAGSET